MPHLVWLHRDLRTADNHALFHAAKANRGVVALYLMNPQEWRDHDDAPVKIDFWLRNLAELSEKLRDKNIALLIREATKANTTKAVIDIAWQHNCTDLHINLEYEVNESRRNQAVKLAAQKSGIAVHEYHDAVILPPADIRTGEGRFYTVFSPYKRAYYKLLQDRGFDTFAPLPEPKKQAELIGIPDPVPTSVPGFANPVDPKHWPAGEAHASKRLNSFAEKNLAKYKDHRDLPAIDGTSALSPHLAAGVVSPRQCLKVALDFNSNRLDSGDAGAVHWISEIIWREFYRHVIVAHPRVSMGRAFKPATDRIIWNDDPKAFDAWSKGLTGVPIVDAAMRQLVTLGWMHNRLRMIVAMYLSKDLFLNWRLGERFFMQHLIDGDLGSNNGGWQWSASTGTDAAPYFRIFNPISQSKKCDPTGAFIRKWLPELAAVEGDDIHDPSQLPGLLRTRLDYPDPISHHSAARDRVMKAFQALA